jgi:hypothetical protein
MGRNVPGTPMINPSVGRSKSERHWARPAASSKNFSSAALGTTLTLPDRPSPRIFSRTASEMETTWSANEPITRRTSVLPPSAGTRISPPTSSNSSRMCQTQGIRSRHAATAAARLTMVLT